MLVYTCTCVACTQARMLLHRYELECKYTQYIQLHSRPVWPRLDLAPLVQVLNAIEQVSARLHLMCLPDCLAGSTRADRACRAAPGTTRVAVALGELTTSLQVRVYRQPLNAAL